MCRAEDEPCGEADLLSEEAKRLSLGREHGGRSEPAPFVEFFIVREIGFRHKAEEFSSLDDGGAVEQHAVTRHGDANEGDEGEVTTELDESQECGLSLFKEQLLSEKVLTGVACQTEFRETEHFHALSFGAHHHVLDGFGVGGGVCEMHGGDTCCHFDVTVLHIYNRYRYKKRLYR